MSFESFNCCLRPVARLAEAFEVGKVIGPPICFGGDVIHRLRRCIPSISQAFLTEVFIPVENDWTQPVPLAAIAALMPALPSLMLLPAFIAMVLAVTRTICCCAWTTAFTACSGYQCWHHNLITGNIANRHALRRSVLGAESG